MIAPMHGALGAILLLLALGLCLTEIQGQHSNIVANHTNVCFGRNSGSERVVHTCNQLVVCTNGHPNLRQCSTGQLYNHITQQCEPQTAALLRECFRCPDNTSHVNLPADFQCNQFVRCFRGTPEQRSCSEGLLFDPVTRTCNFADRVKCACPAVDRPTQPWFIRDRYNCGKFDICIRGAYVPLTCPPGLHFNQTQNQCDSPREPACIWLDQNANSTTPAPPSDAPSQQSTTLSAVSTPIPPSGPFRCPSNGGIYFEPHPQDCTQFYICAYGDATIRTCPNNSLFDGRTRSCVDPQFAECFAAATGRDFTGDF